MQVLVTALVVVSGAADNVPSLSHCDALCASAAVAAEVANESTKGIKDLVESLHHKMDTTNVELDTTNVKLDKLIQDHGALRGTVEHLSTLHTWWRVVEDITMAVLGMLLAGTVLCCGQAVAVVLWAGFVRLGVARGWLSLGRQRTDR